MRFTVFRNFTNRFDRQWQIYDHVSQKVHSVYRFEIDAQNEADRLNK